MREIKFRAWNKVDKTMYTDAINNCKDTFDMVLKHPQIYEVMQYTGLKDMNNVEIYEGDIIKYHFKSVLLDEKTRRERISPIFRSDFRAAWAVRDNKQCNSDLFRYVQNGNVVEVIGNIYENPELLEG